MCSVQFQIAPCSSLHFSISVGPFRCSRCYLRGFDSAAPVPSEAVPFVWLVCRSPVCLTSALTQAGGGGLLFRFAGSVALRGGRGPADRCRWRVWGALAVFRPHWVHPRSRRVLSLSALLRLPAALCVTGPELRAVPVFGHSTKAQPRLGLRFVPSLA